MKWKAKWVWIEGEESPKNFWLAVRKTVNVKEDIKEAKLHITADSRYVLWLNGKRLGQGPVRSWPWDLSYDSYCVKSLLRRGQNVISVLVLHYGVSNFQYIANRGGLIAQIDMVTSSGKKIVIGTDRTWEGMPHPSYGRNTARISCQQGWVEQYTAEEEPEGWNILSNEKSGSKTGKWKSLKEIGETGISPWKKLSPRKIPFLTEEPVYPSRILRQRTVKPVNQHFGFDLKPNLLPQDRTCNNIPLCGFAVTILHSPGAIKAKVFCQDGNWHDSPGKLKVNGKKCPWIGMNSFDRVNMRAECSFKRGDNLISWDISGSYHVRQLTFSLDIPFEADLRMPFSSKKGKFIMATLGPVDKDDRKTLEGIQSAAEEDDLRPYKNILRPVSPADEISANIFAETTQVEELKEVPGICNHEYLCVPNENESLIYPAKSGDVEILVDFGKEISGFLEFEIEAERGITLDFNCFEAIQEGKINFTWSLRNVLRYVTKEGGQFYHSVIRRGFRYALLVIRFPGKAKKPLKIKFLRCLLNTYPVTKKGEFVSNDAQLNEIWEMGAYTTRLCMEDTFVDCPAYEQAFWVGDSRNEGAVNHTAFGEYSLTRRCLLLAAGSLKRSPVVESQVPSGWKNILTAWSMLWVLACDEFYQTTGDIEFVRKIYPAISKQNSNFGKMSVNGLISINAWNMLDWVPMDTPGDAIAVTHQNAWYVESLKRSARLANVLGKKKEAEKWLAAAENVKNAINRELWDEKKKAYIDCIRSNGEKSPVISQQTNTIVFLCDCAAARRKGIIKSYIAGCPAGFVKTGSPFMMFFVFEALAKLGSFEKILKLIRKNWGFMLDRDATTCWEMFPGFYSDGRWTRSHCHAWSTAPVYFLSAYQLGIIPEEPGFKKVRIAPKPAGLKWVRGNIPTPRGKVEVSWEKTRGVFKIEVCLPHGVTGRLLLPEFIRKNAKFEISGNHTQSPVFTGKNWQLHLKGKNPRVIVVARTVPEKQQGIL